MFCVFRDILSRGGEVGRRRHTDGAAHRPEGVFGLGQRDVALDHSPRGPRPDPGPVSVAGSGALHEPPRLRARPSPTARPVADDPPSEPRRQPEPGLVLQRCIVVLAAGRASKETSNAPPSPAGPPVSRQPWL